LDNYEKKMVASHLIIRKIEKHGSHRETGRDKSNIAVAWGGPLALCCVAEQLTAQGSGQLSSKLVPVGLLERVATLSANTLWVFQIASLMIDRTQIFIFLFSCHFIS